MNKLFLVGLLTLIFGITSTSAQPTENEESPFLAMLARIPAQSGASEWLTYIDYQALIAARPGAPSVSSWEEFEAVTDGDSEEGGLLMSALMSIQSGPSEISQYLMYAGEAIDVIGFDLFAVERAAQYGNPPDSVTILAGDFDNDAITAAFEARDYTATSEDDLTLLCAANGCDSGMETNLADRNPANIFGGQLGRSQPLLLGEQWLASSPNDVALNGVAEAIGGDSVSVAEQPTYRAAAEAISASGTVLQAYFINPAEIGNLSDVLMGSRLTPEQIKALRAELARDFEPMPFYSLIALAEVATESEDLTQFALVYSNTADAQAAAELFPARIENYTSLATNQPFIDILTDRGVTSIDTAVHESSTGSATLVITLHAPLPSSEITDEGSASPSMGLVYSAFVRAYMQRDLGWLATQF